MTCISRTSFDLVLLNTKWTHPLYFTKGRETDINRQPGENRDENLKYLTTTHSTKVPTKRQLTMNELR